MTMSKMFFAAALTIFPSLAASTACAQYGFHVDHHDHVIKDSHGHVIGRYHQDVIHRDAQHIVPHQNTVNHGTYYHQNGHSYYHPQTAMLGAQQAAPTPQEITFGGYGHVDDLAQRLEFLMNDLCLDLYYNYSHNPGFRETYSEAYSLLETAKYIHAAEHAKDRDAISRKLGGADALFHHVEDDVRGWSRVHHRQIGTLGILSKIEMAESVLHHLMEDVGVQPEIPEHAPAPGIGGPELAPPPSAFGPR
jgi:hypothetical protein